MPQLGFEVLPHMCNPARVCHGGMMMTVLDSGLAFILHAALNQQRVFAVDQFQFRFFGTGAIRRVA